jgi:hypothetical protein
VPASPIPRFLFLNVCGTTTLEHDHAIVSSRHHAEKSGLRNPEVSAFWVTTSRCVRPGPRFAPHLVLIPGRRQLG